VKRFFSKVNDMQMGLFLRGCILSGAALLCLAATPAAMSQQWPDKPIRLVVPAPPGGITDGVARLVAEQLHHNLGQPVIVENKPGGSAVIAERTVMNAPADGYTMMVAPSSVLTDFPLSVKMPFDPNKTFTYVAEVARMVHVLVANANFGPNDVKSAIVQAEKSVEPVSVASLSPGTRSDLLGKLLREQSGGKILVVPYKGSTPAMTDLLGNQVQMAFEVVSNVVSLIKSGKLKGLAVVSSVRSEHLPGVPSFSELEMPQFVMPDASVGVFLLSSTPAPMAERIGHEVQKITRDSQFRKKLAANGLEMPPSLSVDALQKKIADTTAQNRKLMGLFPAMSEASK